LLAQDVRKVFPELVTESNAILSVNYQGMVPVLINAIKEQDVTLKKQEEKMNKQQKEIDLLKKMIQKILED
jgi:hypothetical protein